MKDFDNVNPYTISDELLTAYIEGKTNEEETIRVANALKHDKQLREAFFFISNLEQGYEAAGRAIPMVSMAADAPDNLCDILCEAHILRDYADETDVRSLAESARENRWIKEEGMPLHNMGRLLEDKGMSVMRKYDCTLSEAIAHLAVHNKVIAVVDYGVLVNGCASGHIHAIRLLAQVDSLLHIFDPALNKEYDVTTDRFEAAWQASRHYLVSASTGSLEYEPHPISVDDVCLDEGLLELTEAIAENAHEVWAFERKKEGWRYGEKRNDALRQHPDMVPYSDLTEAEKEYDRKMAFNTLRLVKKLGFTLDSPSSKRCPRCGEPIREDMNFCPCCGTRQ